MPKLASTNGTVRRNALSSVKVTPKVSTGSGNLKNGKSYKGSEAKIKPVKKDVRKI